jgi:hypothetical protein
VTALQLAVLPWELALCSLPPTAQVPDWVLTSGFFSVTRTVDELSIVCPVMAIPAGFDREGPWACIEVQGPLDLALTGILATLAVPLADARIPIFVISTYRTDYLLVRAGLLPAAKEVLRRAGHHFA